MWDQPCRAGLGSTDWLVVTSAQALILCDIFLPAPKFSLFLALMWSLWGVRVFQLPACLCVQSQCQILHRGSGCCELCQHRSYGVSGQPLSAPFPEQTLLHVKDPAHSYRLNGRELSAKWAVPTVLPPPQSGQGVMPFLLRSLADGLCPQNSPIFHFCHLV